jgi:beta-phosphoglucomutase-like phosphatase (HAD superfamily)
LAKELGDKLVEYQRLTERSSAILRQYGELEREIQRERESIEERLQRRGAAHANLDAPSAPDVQELKRKVDEKRFALGQAIESDTSVYEGRIEALAKDPDFAAVERSVVEAEARTALLANPELAPFIELIVMHAISFRVTGHAARESWRADLRSRAQPQTRDYEAIG